LEVSNKIRLNPLWLVPHLEEMLEKFDPKDPTLMLLPGRNMKFNEGAEAVRECITFLKR
jgi:hypothetical protein